MKPTAMLSLEEDDTSRGKQQQQHLETSYPQKEKKRATFQIFHSLKKAMQAFANHVTQL